MPSYDYRCERCGAELEIIHRIHDVVAEEAHQPPETNETCQGPLVRLISQVGYSKSVGTKGPSDGRLKGLGFTKYVRGDKGYEKAFGPGVTPDFINRE